MKKIIEVKTDTPFEDGAVYLNSFIVGNQVKHYVEVKVTEPVETKKAKKVNEIKNPELFDVSMILKDKKTNPLKKLEDTKEDKA
jgi:hypothetical protein